VVRAEDITEVSAAIKETILPTPVTKKPRGRRVISARIGAQRRGPEASVGHLRQLARPRAFLTSQMLVRYPTGGGDPWALATSCGFHSHTAQA
jgi:hypothetical protein